MSPRDLVEAAVAAEEAGFATVVVSDHFHPWIEEQGQSPFVWSVLGAIAERTDRVRIGTGVTCPFLRIHPALVAQAAATTSILSQGRFFLGLGTGENLNEHIIGGVWPRPAERREMLVEAVEIIRRLWEGEETTFRGEHLVVESAKLYSRPERPPDLLIAASGTKAAELAAQHGDGLISTTPDASLVEAYRATAEAPHRTIGQLTVSWDEDEEIARQVAHRTWPTAAMGGSLSPETYGVHEFEAIAELVSEDDIARSIVCTARPEPIVEAVSTYLDAGFDEVAIHQVGPPGRHSRFIRMCAEEVLPRFEPGEAADQVA